MFAFMFMFAWVLSIFDTWQKAQMKIGYTTYDMGTLLALQFSHLLMIYWIICPIRTHNYTNDNLGFSSLVHFWMQCSD